MKVDLRKAKAGDTVKFRCGGEAVVKKIKIIDGNIYIYFDNKDDAYGYFKNGVRKLANDYLLEIIEVIPAPFDWNTAKKGMAFKYTKDGGIYWFISNPLTQITGGWAIFSSCDDGSGATDDLALYMLVRTPEHDLEVE